MIPPIRSATRCARKALPLVVLLLPSPVLVPLYSIFGPSPANAQDVTITVEEVINVSDAPAVIPPATITANEFITVTDAPAVIPPAEIGVVEVINVTDVPEVVPPAIIEVAEAINVTDVPEVVPPAIIELAEAIVVADAPDVMAGPLTLAVNAADDVDDGTCDATHCSLREAINVANANIPARDDITFNIPGPGPHSIQPLSALPTITDPVVIDGYTQPGASPNTNPPELGTNAVLMIELDGTNAGDNASGLFIEAGGSTVRGLVINRFPGGGDGIIILFEGGNRIQGNFIGTDVSGTKALGNDVGVLISAGAQTNVIGTDGDGVDDVAERNIISGNNGHGVVIQRGPVGAATDQNVVAGNLIGTDATGTVAVGNRRGVVIVNGPRFNRIGSDGDGVADAAERNVISGNINHGVLFLDPAGAGTAQNVVAGNYIGTDVGGTVALGNRTGVQLSAPDNIIGGTVLGARNVIAGNLTHGVILVSESATGNQVLGNYIGTDVTGQTGIPNGTDGIRIRDAASNNQIGGTEDGSGNLISGNARNGISIGFLDGTNGNVIQGNYIGTDQSGNAALGNGSAGVAIFLDAVDNLVGGEEAGAGNVIAFNAGVGVLLNNPSPTIRNRISRNSIFSNGDIGIDLSLATTSPFTDGVTLNDVGDADTGPNNLQNFPVITGFAPVTGAAPGTITGTLNSTPNTPFTLEFFSNPLCDASAHGEGETVLTTLSVTTDGLGDVDFSASIPMVVDESAFLTTTATDNTGSTSEFSRCRAAGYTVVEGGFLITSEPVAVSPSGGPGFTLEADQLTLVSLCSVSTIRMTTGDQITAGCGSAIIEVEVGPIEILLDDNTEAIVPTNAIVTVEEVEERQIQIQNDSPAGTEPVQITVGGTVVGEIGSGETILQATVAVATAEVRLADGDEDEFEVTGTLTLGSTNDGTDVLNEDVTVVLGSFRETVPAGSFERDDRRNEFKVERDPAAFAGITEMRIKDTGEFTIEARNLELSALDLTQAVPFALQIGDDIGSVAIPFDEDGEFQDLVASAGAVLAGAFDLRVGPESLTVAPRQAATFTVSLGARGVFAGKTVSLSCADLPVGASCTFAPRTLTPDAGGASSVLTVTTDGSEGMLHGASRRAKLPLGLGLAALVLGGLALGRSNGRRRRRTFLSLGLLLLIVGLYTACDDEVLGPRGIQPTPRGTHAFKVIATAGTEERAIAVTLTVGDQEAPSEDRAIRDAIR